ncbi:MAG TPA: helix-turn-helix domain-containing protein [Aquabacterium sp.]|uniref:GlxA family transcriptional regulator n=1 Tax=Aquabacterium sp. TaxID=1872578 RepID=UPI002E34587B|nr:helix-turn-helix domain-containing protein [Aquabacterium sp.]HEX5354831.1 helix-turn-helix domain-containing protein [Aquabacterium sp.]
MRSANRPIIDIVMVVFPDFLLLDATGPLQVFSMADQEAAKAGRSPRYRLRTVSREGGLITSSSGLAVQTTPLPRPASLKGATLFVAGGEGTERAMQDKRLIRWLQLAVHHVGRCCSICTGAFVLAQAGLLDGRRAVTHWQDAPLFRQRFPRVAMLDDAIHVHDGHLHTSAGVTAGIDLSLSLVEADHDRALSLRVAKRMVVPLRRAGGQRQFSAALLAQDTDGNDLASRLTSWLQPRLKQTISVADMASAVSMSERTLHRQLMDQTGQSPARLLARLRLEKACALLEGGRAPLKRIVQQTGFGSEYNLRRTFKQVLGVTPGDYMLRFSSGRTRT